ncbi:MAG: hypothetical protein WA982_07370 [Rubrobacteraceae bacterium]
MTEGYDSETSAQERARKRLQELEAQRRGTSSGVEEIESPERGETAEKASEYAEQGQEKAAEAAEQGREKAKGQIATQKERASGELQGISQALQKTGEQLREQDQDSVGRYVDQAADQVGRLSDYLGEKDSEELVSEVEDFARNQPAVFLGGAFILGVAAARFLKSSAGQTGDLKEELKQEARELQESVRPDSGSGR